MHPVLRSIMDNNHVSIQRRVNIELDSICSSSQSCTAPSSDASTKQAACEAFGLRLTRLSEKTLLYSS